MDYQTKPTQNGIHPVENGFGGEIPLSKEDSTRQQVIKCLIASVDTINHMIAFVVTFYGAAFALRGNTSLTLHNWHILLCVIGYQFFMVVAILAFRDSSGPTRDLKRNHKRTFHLILQMIGSILAIAGSAIQIYSRGGRFNTIHGITGLVAMICTVASLITSIPALYSQELKSAIKPSLSKFSHIFFGAAAFVIGMVCLMYGMDKNSFRGFATESVAMWLIGFSIVTTVYCVLYPLFNMYDRLKKSF